MTRGARTRFLTAASALTFLAAGSEARASLIGLDVTVTFVEPSFLDTVDTVVVTAGQEIAAGDLSNIGGGILLGGEFIDIGDSSIVYRVRGDGPPLASPTGYSTTGFDPLAYYLFDFDFASAGDQIVGVMIVLQDVIGVEFPTEVAFTGNSVTLLVGTLGVLEVAGGPDLGRITLNLTIESTGPPGGAVPEPSSFAALGLGLAALAWYRRRRG
jgi:hypothetical protein